MKKLIFIIIASISLAGFAWDANALDPMRVTVGIALPEGINTVGPAAQFYADTIGYHLVTNDPAPPESATIAKEGLETLSTTRPIMPIEEAILALLRDPYVLVVDHEHQLFSFEKGGDAR